MPFYKKSEEILGYVIGEKVWCKDCWEKEKSKKGGVPVKQKDLKKSTYVCDGCGGTLPITFEYRLSKVSSSWKKEESKPGLFFPKKGGNWRKKFDRGD